MLEDLPFDMYQRYNLISEIIEKISVGKKLKILDVGGHPGIISEFLPNHDCIITDLLEVKQKQFVKSSGLLLPFKNKSFDLVISTDVLEHIDPKNRNVFLDEIHRVSKDYLIVGAPFWSKEVEQAEKESVNYINTQLRSFSPYLDEHAEFGIPKIELITEFSENKEMFMKQYHNGYLPNWLSMQKLVHKISRIDEKLYHIVNEFYNKHFYEDDNSSPSYRKIILLSNKKLEDSIFTQKQKNPKSAKDFVRIINFILDNFSLSKLTTKDIEDPLGKLLLIYQNRDDLQNNFKKVKDGQYKELIEWAARVASNKTKDSSADILRNKAEWYLSEYRKFEEFELQKGKIDELNKLNSQKANKIDELNKLNSQKANKIDELNKLNSQKANKIEDLDMLNSQKANKIDELNKLNSQKANKIEDLDMLNSQKANKIDELNTLNSQKANKIDELNTLNSQKANKIDELNTLNSQKANKINELETRNKKLYHDRKKIENELTTIKQSVIFNATRKIAKTIDKIFPKETSRGNVLEVAMKSKKVIKDEGLNSYLEQASNKIKKREFKIVKPAEPTKDFKQFFSAQTLYSKWLSLNELNQDKINNIKKVISNFSYEPKISIIVPVYNTPPNVLKETIESVTSQLYPNWELCLCDDASTSSHVRNILNQFQKEDSRIKIIFSKTNGGISRASNNALSLATGEFIGLLDHDDVLTKDALFEVVRHLNNDPKTDYVYSDEDKIDQNGQRLEPFFKPDWSPELFFSINYVTHFSVIRKSIVDKIGGFRPEYAGSQDYDLILRVTEETDRIAHIPKILYNWRKISGSASGQVNAKPYAFAAAKKALSDACKRRRIKAKVLDGLFTGSYRINYEIHGNPLISIVILNKDNKIMLKQCINSIKSKSTFKNYEIIIVDHNSKDPATLEYLKTLPYKVIKYNGKFNFSRMNNLGVKNSKGEYIIILNNDVKVIEPDWIQALLEHVQKPDVGIAGAKLLFPDDNVQHAGTIIGFNGYAHNYGGFHKSDPGYYGMASVVRECSAVTAACFMIKRTIFDEVNGFDEKMAQSWQDVDICLRVLQKGNRIIYTPYSLLYHITGGTRGKIDVTPEEISAKNIFKKKHAQFLNLKDPYYNPNLMLHEPAYFVNIDLSHYDDPLDLLLGLYLERDDLQREMPEVKKGDYNSLINWAAKSGLNEDHSRSILQRFKEYYISSASKA